MQVVQKKKSKRCQTLTCLIALLVALLAGVGLAVVGVVVGVVLYRNAMEGGDGGDWGGGDGNGPASPFSIGGSVPVALSRRGLFEVEPADVDLVYAVNTNPRFGYEYRKKAIIASDGSFNITLSKNEPWILAFLDTSKVGSDMVQAVLTAESLNSIYGMKDSSEHLDLGECNATKNSTKAEIGVTYEGFIDELGLSSTAATDLGGRDGLMLRYANPDMDGDGNIDMDQTNIPGYELTLWIHYLFGDPDGDYLTDYIKQKQHVPFTDLNLTFIYTGPELGFRGIDTTNHKVVYHTQPEKWELEWSDGGDLEGTYSSAFYNQTFNGGHYLPNNEWQTMIFNFGSGQNDYSLKITFGNEISNPPEGTYTYNLYSDEESSTPDETITFTNIDCPDNTANTSGYIFPFIIFETDANGYVQAFNYIWKKFDETTNGFTDASSDDLEMNMGRQMAQVKWNAGQSISDESSWSPYPDYDLTGRVERGSFNRRRRGLEMNDPILLADVDQVSISFTSISGITFKVMIEDHDGDTHNLLPD